jgi:hypothetical protein
VVGCGVVYLFLVWMSGLQEENGCFLCISGADEWFEDTVNKTKMFTLCILRVDEWFVGSVTRVKTFAFCAFLLWISGL